MKRVTYISNFNGVLTETDVEQIGQVSVANNKRAGLTGVLLCFSGIFFQILEGEDEQVDQTYARIRKDARHKNIFLVNMEEDVRERLYPEWEMKLVVLDDSTHDLVRSVRSLLGSVTRTHRILEKYAPITVLRRIQEGINPLNLSFRNVKRTVLFSDLFASTTLAEHLGPAQLSQVLDQFYRVALAAIDRRRGTISKLTGDGLMAYWPADRTDDAIRAATELLSGLKEIRDSAAPGDPVALMFGGVGISSGMVIEGNIGSDIKKDYTVLGDVVNRAARLEGVTRRAPYGLVFDRSVIDYTRFAWDTRKLGRYRAKGKVGYLDIYTLNDEVVRLQVPEGGLLQAILRNGLAQVS